MTTDADADFFPCECCEFFNADRGCLGDAGCCPAIWDGERDAELADTLVALTDYYCKED